MTIRLASNPEELAAIYRFRYAIYIEEMGKPMPGADHERRELRDELDDQAIHLYTERDAQIVGVLRIILGHHCIPDSYVDWYGLDRFREFPPSDISFNGRMMVDPKYRSSPMAFSLVQKSYEIGRDQGIAFNFSHTTPPLFSFFERLGCRRYKNDFIDPDLGTRTPMVLVLEDIDHLEDCKSPLASIAHKTANRPKPVAWFRQQFGTLCPA